MGVSCSSDANKDVLQSPACLPEQEPEPKPYRVGNDHGIIQNPMMGSPMYTSQQPQPQMRFEAPQPQMRFEAQQPQMAAQPRFEQRPSPQMAAQPRFEQRPSPQMAAQHMRFEQRPSPEMRQAPQHMRFEQQASPVHQAAQAAQHMRFEQRPSPQYQPAQPQTPPQQMRYEQAAQMPQMRLEKAQHQASCEPVRAPKVEFRQEVVQEVPMPTEIEAPSAPPCGLYEVEEIRPVHTQYIQQDNRGY